MDTKKNKKEAVKNKGSQPDLSWTGRLNAFFEVRQRLFFLLSLGITLLLSYLLFDVRVSLTGDDAAYIERARDFLSDFVYPSFQGPLYPVFLSLIMAVTGMHVVVLKVASVVCTLGFVTFTYLTLRNRIPALLSCSILLLIALNSEIMYYASQTYSEAFYMLMASWGLWFYVTHFIDRKGEYSLGRKVLMIIVLDVILLLMGLSRSVGYVGIVVVTVYGLMHRKQWKETGLIVAGFIGVYAVWSVVKGMLWHSSQPEFASQLAILMQKEPYNAGAGYEDFAGFLQRFWENMKNYISFHFYEIGGLRKFVLPMNTSGLLTFLTALLGLVGLGVTYRKNKVLFLLGLYTGGFLVLTFFIIQVFWNQSRLIVPVVPYFMLLLLAALYYFPWRKRAVLFRFLLPFLIVGLLLAELGRAGQKVKEASKITGPYYGLTPDWIHYVKASEWAAEHLPKDVVVSCRKASISFIYGKGRKFNGIVSVPSEQGEIWQKKWEEAPARYIVIPRGELDKPLPAVLVHTFRSYLHAYYFSGTQMYYVMEGEPEKMTDFRKQLEASQVGTVTHVDLKEKDFTIYPDKLLENLRRKSVDYVITANLRINPAEKTGRIINTVERYLQYISIKYPGLFVKVAQIGSDQDEPATVMKIDYSKLPDR